MPVKTFICERCHQTFESRWLSNPNKYCSDSCRLDAMHERNKRPTSKQCELCGAVITKRPSVLATRVYCSKACADQARTMIIGEEHPLFKPKVVMSCTVCGKVCEVKPSLESRFRACSRRCASTLAKLTYPRTSSIEQAVADAMTELGESFVPQKQFQYYVVDFWLPAYNAVIECDGAYWHALPKQVRIDKAKDSYFRNRSIPLIRLTEQEIKASAMDAVQRALHLVIPHRAA